MKVRLKEVIVYSLVGAMSSFVGWHILKNTNCDGEKELFEERVEYFQTVDDKSQITPQSIKEQPINLEAENRYRLTTSERNELDKLIKETKNATRHIYEFYDPKDQLDFSYTKKLKCWDPYRAAYIYSDEVIIGASCYENEKYELYNFDERMTPEAIGFLELHREYDLLYQMFTEDETFAMNPGYEQAFNEIYANEFRMSLQNIQEFAPNELQIHQAMANQVKLDGFMRGDWTGKIELITDRTFW